MLSSHCFIYRLVGRNTTLWPSSDVLSEEIRHRKNTANCNAILKADFRTRGRLGSIKKWIINNTHVRKKKTCALHDKCVASYALDACSSCKELRASLIWRLWPSDQLGHF